MKTVEEILESNKSVYLWENKTTLDVEVNDEKKGMLEELLSFTCLLCDNRVISQSSKLIRKITDTDNGAQVKCESCKQEYFIHKPIIIPKNLQNN
jgi:transcription elongation factor Elf1